MLQRQVSAVLLCRSRCASFSGHGRPCDHTAYVPAVTLRTWGCLRFRPRQCYRFQLFCRVVYVQCKLCKHRRFHSAVLGLVVHAPVVMLRQLLGVGQCRILWRFRSCSWCSSWWLSGPPVVFVTTGACAGPDSAENVKIPHAFLDMVHCPSLCYDRCRFVETVQNTVDSPQLVLLLDKVVDVPRVGHVMGPRLVCQLIMAMICS